MNSYQSSFLILVFQIYLTLSESRSPIDCNFDKSSFCGWKKLNFKSRDYNKRVFSYKKDYKKNMFPKNMWKLANKIKKTSIHDITDINGKFLLFKSKHHLTINSLLKSRNFMLPNHLKEVCLNFYVAIGDTTSKRRSKKSLPKLKVYVVPKGGRTKRQNLVWTSEEMSKTNHFQKLSIHILKRTLLPSNKRKFRVFFEVVRGQTPKAYIAVDDIQLKHCYSDSSVQGIALPTLRSSKERNSQQRYDKISHKMGKPASTPPNIVIPNRNFKTFQKVLEYNTAHPNLLQFDNVDIKKFFSQATNSSLDSQKDYKINFFSSFNETKACNLFEYTSRVSSCLKIFFNDLASIGDICSDLYDQLEVCVQSKAISCIPDEKIDAKRVNKTVTDILRKNFNTKQVYCIEQGAFVYPVFSFENLPRCSDKYFEKITRCSDIFTRVFQSQQEIDLCHEYYKANECQRLITAQECTFTLDDMLSFGLKMVYQQAHNPFCAELSNNIR